MLWLVLGASFFFIARAGEICASKEGCWDDGQILRREDGFFRGSPNSIGQCGVRLIASRFGFGAQKGTNCRTE